MRIGFVYDAKADYQPGEGDAPDENAELSFDSEIEILAETIQELGHNLTRIGDLDQLLGFIQAGKEVDLIFNYAVGKWGVTREAQIPALLEAFRIPYTGADSLSLTIGVDKAITKRLWIEAGLPTPEFCVVSDIAELECDQLDLPDYPLFVKPVHEGSSKGISEKSLVHTESELLEHVAYMIPTYHQPALVEAYLPGKEYSVGVLGNGSGARALGAVEILHSNRGYASYEEKSGWGLQTFTQVDSGDLSDQIAEVARQAYIAVNCREIGRVDIRLDQEGSPSLIEINPNPALGRDDCTMPASARQAGLSYPDLIGTIIQQAVEHWSLNS